MKKSLLPLALMAFLAMSASAWSFTCKNRGIDTKGMGRGYVHHCGSTFRGDDKEQELMRFLEWSNVGKLAPINREMFIKRGMLVTQPEIASFELDFAAGSSQLKVTDSATVAQRDSMLRWIDGCHKGERGFLNRIIIRAYSSPEGMEALNRKLSRGRAATIRAMLASRFPGVEIETQFDENDNIVTWEKISDIMLSEMDDPAAHRHAVRLKEVIADKQGFDAKYRAVRAAGGGLYEYVKGHVLGRLRTVDVQADIIVQKIETKEEIIARYEANPDFRNNMTGYHYYHVLCYLADQERWDELYDVAKRAYEKYPTDMQVMKQLRLESAPMDENDTASAHLRFVATQVPYPLAGYYYAVAALQKGMADVDILKPYLDDGRTGVRDVMNSLPFVVNQVLMYCRQKDYDEAAKMVAKCNLEKFPELHDLVMLVKRLSGHSQNQ